MQFAAAIIGVAVENDGDRGYTSFVLLILELNLVVWVGYYSDRNAGNAVKELEVMRCFICFLSGYSLATACSTVKLTCSFINPKTKGISADLFEGIEGVHCPVRSHVSASKQWNLTEHIRPRAVLPVYLSSLAVVCSNKLHQPVQTGQCGAGAVCPKCNGQKKWTMAGCQSQ